MPLYNKRSRHYQFLQYCNLQQSVSKLRLGETISTTPYSFAHSLTTLCTEQQVLLPCFPITNFFKTCFTTLYPCAPSFTPNCTRAPGYTIMWLSTYSCITLCTLAPSSTCNKMASVKTFNKSLGVLPVEIYCLIFNRNSISHIFGGSICNIVPIQIFFLFK